MPSADPKSRVSSSSDVISNSSCFSDRDREGIIDDEDDEDATFDNAPISCFLQSRKLNKEKKTKKRDFDEFSRVLTIRKRSRCSIDVLDQIQVHGFDFAGELESESSNFEDFRIGDFVWAKAFPYTWWPGWIRSRDRTKVLVSFFGCDRTRSFRDSELLYFEKNFDAISKMIRWRLSDAIDSALAELGRRLVLGLMCSCQGSSSMDSIDVGSQHFIEDVKSKKNKLFQPKVVLEFVLRMAVSPWVDDAETVSAIKAGAQVNAFRRYISIKHDWIYRETMMLSESCLTSDDNLEANMIGTHREMQSHSSSDDEKAYSTTKEAKFSDEEQEDNHEAFSEQEEMISGFCKKSRVGHLPEILTHLRCLALDPFYSGTEEGSSVESSASVCQKILMYRALAYHEVLDCLVPIEHSKTLAKENICITNGHGNQEFNACIQHSNKARVEGRNEAVNIDCSLSYMDELSTVEPIVKDAAPCVKYSPICNHETEIDEVMTVSGLDLVSHIHDAATKTHGDNSDVSNEDTHESKILSHHLENDVNIPVCDKSDTDGKSSVDVKVDCNLSCMPKPSPSKTVFEDVNGTRLDDNVGVNIPLCDKSNTDGKSVDVNVDCNLSCMPRLSPNETLFEDVIVTRSDDNVGVATSGATNGLPLLSNLSDCHVKVHHNNLVGVMADVSNKEVSLGIVSKDSTKGKTKLSQPDASDFSFELHKTHTLYPPSMLYASPLVPASNSCSEYPTSLHMKFPKDFKLPSKDELLKQFRSFGPLDYLKTNVYFYTGSAQVVFLRQLDAEVALHYAKRKKIFFSQANVRFWLNRREHSRGGTTTRSSALNLKSCLKTSNPQVKDKRKSHQVKFLPVNQTISLSATTETRNEAFTESDSCEFSSEVGQDISGQMLVLLEKCNQLVCKIKDNLGLQSHYSIFTQNYCHVPKVDDV